MNSKIISATSLTSKIQKFWKVGKFMSWRDNIWLLDQNFWIPKIEDIKEFLKESLVDKMEYIPEMFDCDDFALYLLSECRIYKHKKIKEFNMPKEEWKSWAFGMALGEFSGVDGVHALNFCYAREGFFMIEPQNDRIWEADITKDKPFFILM